MVEGLMKKICPKCHTKGHFEALGDLGIVFMCDKKSCGYWKRITEEEETLVSKLKEKMKEVL